MTETQIEAAARKLCELRGVTPESQTRYGKVDWDTSPLTVIPITHLQDCAAEIRTALQVQEAIASVTTETETLSETSKT